jgi:hypothetical protein
MRKKETPEPPMSDAERARIDALLNADRDRPSSES